MNRKFPAIAAAILVASLHASATERRFTFTYETTTTPKGSVEFENWATWKHTGNPGTAHTELFEFRHEIEFGITDRLQLGLYLFDWQYNRRDEDGRKARWQHSGAELIYSLTNPTTDFLGSAIYGEIVAGEDSLKLEGKLLLQKNFGAFRIAWNAIVEAAWEGGKFGSFEERGGEVAQSLGVSCDISKSFSLGAEILHEIDIPNWENASDSIVFAGPNASARFGRSFVTASGLFQITNIEGEPDAQIRIIAGFDF